MRPSDKKIFLQAATEMQLWILVRRTNVASLPYIGRAGYIPKPLDCKAKTAEWDVGPCKSAGLVVDPTVLPSAFSPAKLEDAMKEWREYGRGMLASGRYVVDQGGPATRGLVKSNGQYLHGDYDLYDIIDPEQAHRNLAAVESMLGHPHLRGPNFFRVQNFVNTRIGVPMIQHGGEMQFKHHTQQAIDAFGPGGEDITILNQHSVTLWYENQFKNRKPLGKEKEKESPKQ